MPTKVTISPMEAPDQVTEIEIGFERGDAVAESGFGPQADHIGNADGERCHGCHACHCSGT